MKNIIIKIGDSVKLFNGTEGVINDIDKSVYQFALSGDYIIWFHIRDIKQLNGETIENDLLVF